MKTRSLSKPLFIAFLTTLLLVTPGCGFFSKITPWGGGEKARPVLTAEIAGDSLMNNGNAASIVFYQLTGVTNFQRTPIEAFWENDREALASELVGSGQQVFLYPGQQKHIELDLSAETRYLGVAANLRAPDPNRWRRTLSLQEIDGRRLAVQIGSSSLTVALQAAE